MTQIDSQEEVELHLLPCHAWISSNGWVPHGTYIDPWQSHGYLHKAYPGWYEAWPSHWSSALWHLWSSLICSSLDWVNEGHKVPLSLWQNIRTKMTWQLTKWTCDLATKQNLYETNPICLRGLRKVTQCMDRCLEYRNLRNHLTNFSQHFVWWLFLFCLEWEDLFTISYGGLRMM
jgi:hypothetical protein